MEKLSKTDLKMIKRDFALVNDLISDCGCECSYIDEYEFKGQKRNWLGAFVASEQNDAHVFPVALNITKIKKLSGDPFTTEMETTKTIAHECGHGFISRLRDDEVSFRGSRKSDETLAEEFARYIMGETDASSIVNALKDNDYGTIETVED